MHRVRCCPGSVPEDEDVEVWPWEAGPTGKGPGLPDPEAGFSQGRLGPLASGGLALAFALPVGGDELHEIDFALFPSRAGLDGIVASLSDRSISFDLIGPAAAAEPDLDEDADHLDGWMPRPIAAQVLSPSPDDRLQVVGRDFTAFVACGHLPISSDRLIPGVVGAELRAGPEYDALRTAIYGNWLVDALPGDLSSYTFWEAARVGDWVTFLTVRPGGSLAHADVSKRDGRWGVRGTGGCRPSAWTIDGFRTATWVLDPDFPAPEPSTTTLHLLVSDEACSGTRTASGRISPAFVFPYGGELGVQLFVESLPRGQDCQDVPPTTAILELPQPLGSLTLRDVHFNECPRCGG